MQVSVLEAEAAAIAEAEPERLDASSFAAAYEKHRLSVYRYLRGRTASEDDALELTAITFEHAFASIGRFRRRDGGVHAWLLRIARNTAIDARRRRRPSINISDAGSLLGRAAIEVDRIGREHTEMLDLVARLPEHQRDALLLRYAGGLTAREIGAVTGRREAAVQKQIERGLAALREELR